MPSESEVAFECVVSADLFARAQLAISTEESRYYLTGVHVSPCHEGGALLVATDGSMLVVLRDPDAHVSGSAIVALNKQMVAALPVSGVLLKKRLLAVRVLRGERSKARAFVVDQPTRVAANEEGAEITPYEAAATVLADPDRRVRCAQFGPLDIDGTFPDWRRVLPDDLDPNAPAPVFDHDKLQRLARALCGRKEHKLYITPSRVNPRDSAALITPASSLYGDRFAILMPLRDEAPRSIAVPAWAKPPLDKAA